jgi:predicted 3-demethylubiquinone-9 3-methyltransferase (glyoxalase superfamily)
MNVLTHLMFQDGRAREAAEWYVSLVPGSSIEQVIENEAGGATVYFTLADGGFVAGARCLDSHRVEPADRSGW